MEGRDYWKEDQGKEERKERGKRGSENDDLFFLHLFILD